MPDGLFPVVVVTPEQILLGAEARAVVLRSSDGDLTVLDGHTPLVTDVVPGEVRIDQEGGAVRLAVHGGYLQVEKGAVGAGAGSGEERSSSGTRVTLLAGVAELADQIDVARAERARSEATAKIEERRAAGGVAGGAASEEGAPGASTGEDRELAEAQAALRRAEVRLAVAGVTTP